MANTLPTASETSESQQYHRVRWKEDFISSSLPIPTIYHILLPHYDFSTQQSSDSNEQDKGTIQYSCPGICYFPASVVILLQGQKGR